MPAFADQRAAESADAQVSCEGHLCAVIAARHVLWPPSSVHRFTPRVVLMHNAKMAQLLQTPETAS
eukprot:6195478-Amphidinium_carterae.3